MQYEYSVVVLDNEFQLSAEAAWVHLLLLAQAAVMWLGLFAIQRRLGAAAPPAIAVVLGLIRDGVSIYIGAVAFGDAFRASWAGRMSRVARRAAALIWGQQQQPGTA